MSRRSSIACLFFLVTATVVPSASADGFALFGSYWAPGDAEGSLGGGLRFSGSLGEVVAIDLRGSYFEEMTDTRGGLDDDVQVIPLELGIRLNFLTTEPVNPYIGGGLGYYFLDASLGEIEDEPGFYLVAGIEAGKPKGVSLLLEAIYREVEGTVVVEPANLPPGLLEQDVEVDFSGFGANVGLVWRY